MRQCPKWAEATLSASILPHEPQSTTTQPPGTGGGHARDHGGHAHGRTTIAGSQDFGAKAADETTPVSSPPTPRVIDILRRYTPSLLTRVRLASQPKSVLSRILLCRTATLKGRLYECPTCHDQCHVYNSCVDRHCPQCGGALYPLVDTPEGLRPLIKLEALHVHEASRGGVSDIGFEFITCWDDEHGLGVLMNRLQCIDLGTADVASSDRYETVLDGTLWKLVAVASA